MKNALQQTSNVTSENCSDDQMILQLRQEMAEKQHEMAEKQQKMAEKLQEEMAKKLQEKDKEIAQLQQDVSILQNWQKTENSADTNQTAETIPQTQDSCR